MAHFLEHLVFKGGEKYPTYRDVNEAAEGIGAVINAYTSHDLVAFHITARAERALEAADLLTDFVGRPRIDAEELDRERGVVVQEIARADDQPAVQAGHLIDEAAFGDHPLGRPVLGPVEHIRDAFDREGIVSFRARRWSPSRGGAFLVGNLEHLDGSVEDLFGRFPSHPEPEPYEPAPPLQARVLVRERDSNQSHLRMAYRPAVDPSDPRQRAALQIYSTLLGGSMASRLFDEIREQRGLAYSVHSYAHAYSDAPVLELSAGLESGKSIEAYRRMREIVTELREQGPTREEVERARAYAAGARAIAFENSRAVASHAAQQLIVYGEDVDPDASIRRLDEATFEEVARDGEGGRRRARGGGCRASQRGGLLGRLRAIRGAVVAGLIAFADRRVRRRHPAAAPRHRHQAKDQLHRADQSSARRAVPAPAAPGAQPRGGPARRRPRLGRRRLRPRRRPARCSCSAARSLRPPASVEKLYTTVAVLDDLGPGTRLQTTVLGVGHLGAERRLARRPLPARRRRSELRGRRLQPGVGGGLRADGRAARRATAAGGHPARHRPRDRRCVPV